jgi:hypothetical protein
MRTATVGLFYMVSLLAATHATAQRLPGVPGPDVISASRHVAEYVAKMNREVRASGREWRGASGGIL